MNVPWAPRNKQSDESFCRHWTLKNLARKEEYTQSKCGGCPGTLQLNDALMQGDFVFKCLASSSNRLIVIYEQKWDFINYIYMNINILFKLYSEEDDILIKLFPQPTFSCYSRLYAAVCIFRLLQSKALCKDKFVSFCLAPLQNSNNVAPIANPCYSSFPTFA